MKALGMIETFGLIGAQWSGWCHAQNSKCNPLEEEKRSRGGLVLKIMLVILGAVKTAVEAAATIRAPRWTICTLLMLFHGRIYKSRFFYSSEIKKESDEEIKSQKELEKLWL